MLLTERADMWFVRTKLMIVRDKNGTYVIGEIGPRPLTRTEYLEWIRFQIALERGY